MYIYIYVCVCVCVCVCICVYILFPTFVYINAINMTVFNIV